MQTKLTLRLDRELIRRAKSHSQRSGKSLSAMVADLFVLLGEHERTEDRRLTPGVRSLRGVLRGGTIGERDYRRHLEEKHR